MSIERFPIDLGGLKPLKLDPGRTALSDEEKSALKHNIQLARDVIVFFTALAGAKGLSGHTGGAYDTVPELMIVRAFIANGTPIVDTSSGSAMTGQLTQCYSCHQTRPKDAYLFGVTQAARMGDAPMSVADASVAPIS